MVKTRWNSIRRSLSLILTPSIETAFEKFADQVEAVRKHVDESSSALSLLTYSSEIASIELSREKGLWQARAESAETRGRSDMAAQALDRVADHEIMLASMATRLSEVNRRHNLLHRNFAELEAVTVRLMVVKNVLAVVADPDKSNRDAYTQLIHSLSHYIKSVWRSQNKEDAQYFPADLHKRLAQLESKVFAFAISQRKGGGEFDGKTLSRAVAEVELAIEKHAPLATGRSEKLVSLNNDLNNFAESKDEEKFRLTRIESQQLTVIDQHFAQAMKSLEMCRELLALTDRSQSKDTNTGVAG